MKGRAIFLCVCAIVIFVLLGLLGTVSGADQPVKQVYNNNQIDIYPPVPTTSDIVRITSSGTWCNSCVPIYQSHQVTSDVIKIYGGPDFSLPPPVCAWVLTPWTFSAEVAPLPVGIYAVEVYASGWYCPSVFDSTSFIVTPAPTSTVMSIDGGILTHHYPGHTTSLAVPPGALSTASVFTISYRIPPATTGQLRGMDHFFELTGTRTTFTVPLTLTVNYSESVRGPIIPGTENLFRWQGNRWVTDNITLTHRRLDGLSTQITQLSLFGVLGESNRVYLPVILK